MGHSRSVFLSSLSVGLLALSACGDHDKKSGDTVKTTERDLTTESMPSFQGTYVSQTARLKINADNSFVMESKDEMSRWKNNEVVPFDKTDSSKGSTLKSKESHDAYCSVRRRGTVKIVERYDQQLMQFTITERTLLDSHGVSYEARSEASDEICNETLRRLKGNDRPAEFTIYGRGKDYFYLTDYNSPGNGLNLDRTDKEFANMKAAESYLLGGFSGLFVAVGKSVDVTDAVHLAFYVDYGPLSLANGKGNASLKMNHESRTLVINDMTCETKTTVEFKIVATATNKATTLSLRSRPLEFPYLGEEKLPELNDKNLEDKTVLCQARKVLMAIGDQELYIVGSYSNSLGGSGFMQGLSVVTR